MTRIQERTLSMQLGVVSFLKKQAAITATIPQFAVNFTPFEATVNAIRDIEQEQLVADSKSNTKSKSDLRMQCVVQLRMVIDALGAYAVGANDNSLLQKTNVTDTHLKSSADTTFASQCDLFYNLAVPLVADLVPYGITAAKLSTFRDDVDSFIDIIPQPRQTIISRANSTEQLVTLFAQAKTQLERISKLVAIKRLTEPTFFNIFTESTKIVSSGSTPIALRITVADNDGVALRSVNCTLTRLHDNKILTYKTNENGTILRHFLQEGMYDVAFTKIGFAPFTTQIILEAGVTFQLHILVDTTKKVFRDGRNPKTGDA
jgi:hypothetical protein